MNNFHVIVDSREKVGYWDFSFSPYCTGHTVRGLETADYTLEGYEQLLAIERKRTTGEIANNLGIKVKQFTAECERLQAFPHRYIICEFTVDDLFAFPCNSGIPKKTWSKLRINGKYLAKKLTSLGEEYSISLIFCQNRHEAMMRAYDIFQCVITQP